MSAAPFKGQSIAAAVTVVALFAAGACIAADGRAPVPELKADKGLVFFYRKFDQEERQVRFKGVLETRFAIKENGVVIGTLPAGTFFYRYAEPGRHYYAVEPLGPKAADHEAGTFVEVSAGERHYVQTFAEEGVSPIRARIFVKYPAQARRALERLDPVETGRGEGTAGP